MLMLNEIYDDKTALYVNRLMTLNYVKLYHKTRVAYGLFNAL